MRIMTKMQGALALSLMAAGCENIPGTEAHAQKKAEATIAAMLNDPSSAQFRNVMSSATSSSTCGEVNGKNGFGAYAGFRRFVLSEKVGAGLIDPAFQGTQAEFDREVRMCDLAGTLDDCPRAREWRQNADSQKAFDDLWVAMCQAAKA